MENPAYPEPLLMSDRDAARMLSMGRSTFLQRVKEGLLPPPVKIGGSTRWRVADLQHFIAALPAPGMNAPC